MGRWWDGSRRQSSLVLIFFAGIILKQAQLLEEVDSLFVDSQVPQLFDAYRVRHGLVSSIFTIVTVAVPTLTLLVGGFPWQDFCRHHIFAPLRARA